MKVPELSEPLIAAANVAAAIQDDRACDWLCENIADDICQFGDWILSLEVVALPYTPRPRMSGAGTIASGRGISGRDVQILDLDAAGRNVDDGQERWIYQTDDRRPARESEQDALVE